MEEDTSIIPPIVSLLKQLKDMGYIITYKKNMEEKKKARNILNNVEFIHGVPVSAPESVIKEIEGLIDLAVSKEREGIKNILWQVREDWRNDGQIQVLDTADYLINLINTK